MLALRMTKQSIQDFAKEAELLADSLKRAFITEGIPEVNSQRMTTEKTVEMCKLSAKSDTVRTCLAAASFSDPKEVIAKLITETNSDNTHRQVLAYERINHSRGNNNHRGQYNNYRNYNFRGQRGRPNNFRQWGDRNPSGNRGNRSSRGSNGNNRNSNNRGYNYNSYNRNNNSSVRVAENAQTPQLEVLGENRNNINYH